MVINQKVTDSMLVPAVGANVERSLRDGFEENRTHHQVKVTSCAPLRIG